MPLKLYYFSFPGRAEVSRLLLTGGNISYQNVRVERKDWLELKPRTPFGQMPVLEVEDGTIIAQSKAIEVYCAKLAGFYPDDPLEAAKADMVIWHLDSMYAHFSATFKIEDPEEKIAERKRLLAGPIREQLTALDKMLEGKEHVAGNQMSHGDISLYVTMSTLRSGLLDGVPTNILDDYPNLKRLRNSTAQVDFVKSYYAKETQGTRLGFKPDA